MHFATCFNLHSYSGIFQEEYSPNSLTPTCAVYSSSDEYLRTDLDIALVLLVGVGELNLKLKEAEMEYI